MISLLEQYVQDVFDYKSRELQFKGKLKELFILRTENKQNEEGELSPFSILVVFLSMQERLLMSKKV